MQHSQSDCILLSQSSLRLSRVIGGKGLVRPSKPGVVGKTSLPSLDRVNATRFELIDHDAKVVVKTL
jgi:hypothetical protein